MFLRGTLHNLTYTIANVYAPNTKQVSFFRMVLYQLTAFQAGTLVLGGDFNVPLLPALDTSNGSSCLKFSALQAIKSSLTTLTLHDTWRTMHPNVKDYTYYSSLHKKYSQIDHFFLTQNNLTSLVEASIEPMLLSDHHPITMSLKTPSHHSRSPIWRLDDSILLDMENTNCVSEVLSNYFLENTTDDTPTPVVWAAHKCVVRGTFISLMAKRTRLRKARIKELSDRVKVLERTHKHTLATQGHDELLKAWEELLGELRKTLTRKYTLTNKLFYEFGNKSGKLLAAAI